MAFQPTSSSSPGRNRFRGTGTLADINIVPLVDVLLVLLVIFMLTAHVMEYGLEIEVPQVKREKSSAEVLPVINIDRTGNLYLGEKSVNINDLGGAIKQRFPKATDVYVRADAATTWSPIAQVVSELNEAKLKVRMVTKPMESGRRRR